MEQRVSGWSLAPASPYHWLAQTLATFFAYDLDPSRPLLSPSGEASHLVDALELDLGERGIPGIRFTPKHSNGAGICFTHAAGAPQVLPYYRLIREMLGAGYTVLFYELDGHGRNPYPLNASDVLDIVPAAIRTLRREFDRVGLVGMSLGSVLSLRAAAQDPDLAAMVLLSPPLRVELSDWELLGETLGTFFVENAPLLLETSLEHMLAPCLGTVHFDGHGRHAMVDRGFIAAMAHLIAELDPLGHAPHVQEVPTRILYGEWDRIVPPRSSQELIEALAAPADRLTLPRRTHFTLLFEPRTAHAIVEWLDLHMGA
jgi:pimeloyl-ACP methyl ester carboxylesterase